MARLTVRVQPGARTSRFTGWYGDHPRLAVTAPPVDGAANDAACQTIARAFAVREREVRLVIGAASRTKHFELAGIDADEVERRLVEILGPRPTAR